MTRRPLLLQDLQTLLRTVLLKRWITRPELALLVTLQMLRPLQLHRLRLAPWVQRTTPHSPHRVLILLHRPHKTVPMLRLLLPWKLAPLLLPQMPVHRMCLLLRVWWLPMLLQFWLPRQMLNLPVTPLKLRKLSLKPWWWMLLK